MTTRIFIPCDTTALSMGADKLVSIFMAEAEKHNSTIEIVRNGSRGMFWLEPLVEIETSNGRMAYGPVEAQDVASLFESGLLTGSQQHPLALGLTEEIPFSKTATSYLCTFWNNRSPIYC